MALGELNRINNIIQRYEFIEMVVSAGNQSKSNIVICILAVPLVTECHGRIGPYTSGWSSVKSSADFPYPQSVNTPLIYTIMIQRAQPAAHKKL